jgi:hypothetical protein
LAIDASSVCSMWTVAETLRDGNGVFVFRAIREADREAAQPARMVEGYVHDTSFDQTGRMNLTIGNRSDRYALGTTAGGRW